MATTCRLQSDEQERGEPAGSPPRPYRAKARQQADDPAQPAGPASPARTSNAPKASSTVKPSRPRGPAGAAERLQESVIKAGSSKAARVATMKKPRRSSSRRPGRGGALRCRIASRKAGNEGAEHEGQRDDEQVAGHHRGEPEDDGPPSAAGRSTTRGTRGLRPRRREGSGVGSCAATEEDQQRGERQEPGEGPDHEAPRSLRIDHGISTSGRTPARRNGRSEHRVGEPQRVHRGLEVQGQADGMVRDPEAREQLRDSRDEGPGEGRAIRHRSGAVPAGGRCGRRRQPEQPGRRESTTATAQSWDGPCRHGP